MIEIGALTMTIQNKAIDVTKLGSNQSCLLDFGLHGLREGFRLQMSR